MVYKYIEIIVNYFSGNKQSQNIYYKFLVTKIFLTNFQPFSWFKEKTLFRICGYSYLSIRVNVGVALMKYSTLQGGRKFKLYEIGLSEYTKQVTAISVDISSRSNSLTSDYLLTQSGR